ncbi:MAG: TrkH family potassium uptake protein [Candidatus Saccharicenans sp.]|nr:TrkH family potassium uptake protein [Candidatus Saccharicenans sp.]
MNNFKKKLVHPPRLLALSFLVAIAVGTILLKLPFSTRSSQIPLIDALFTSASAICVTGLTVVDTPTYFSSFGLGLLLLMIQLGGLGIMTFSSFILLTAGRRVSLSDKLAVEGSFRPEPISDFRTLLKDVFIFTFTFELIGALLLLVRFSSASPLPGAISLSVFHSISAFCNAGFSLFSNSMIDYRGDVYLNAVMMLLIISGGLGFFVLQEIKTALKNTIKGERVRFSLHTKFVAAVTLGIIVGGAVLLFLMEFNQSFREFTLGDKILASIFQAVTARTAGFNTVEIGQLSVASLLLIILIMFVGASPGGTGGGVKTTTFGVVLAFLRSKIRGYEVPQVFSRALRTEDIIKAYTLISLAMTLVFASTLSLLIIQPQLTLKEALFEVVSAFGTVGLSCGITPGLHPLNKLILVITMYIGRVGPLTLLYAFSRQKPAGHYQFIEENVMVG